jgi:hypothetical protein
MDLRRWYALSGDHPDLGLRPTASGTRYLIDTDPARYPTLNPARTIKERLRRMMGREPKSRWHGVAGFSAITEGWNSAVFASRYGSSGSMIVFGGGHNDYFGSDVHAFDLASREWRRIADGYLSGADDEYGAGALYPDSVYPGGSPLPPHTYDYVQYDPVGNDYVLFKGQTELGPDVKAVAIPHLFNLDTLAWRHGPRHPAAWGPDRAPRRRASSPPRIRRQDTPRSRPSRAICRTRAREIRDRACRHRFDGEPETARRPLEESTGLNLRGPVHEW